MEITTIGRNAEIHPSFREYVEEKVSKVELFYPRVQRVTVELMHERNPRQAETAERIELTVYGPGPVIRAEASSSDRYAAVDIAAGKLFERLRRARDRAKDHHRHRDQMAPEIETADIEHIQLTDAVDARIVEMPPKSVDESPGAKSFKVGEIQEDQLGDSPVVVRQKLHEAVPMTVSQALYQMELVGHPFFLFIDSETSQPCVVYHRRGWTYGVIRLDAKMQ